MTWTSYTDRQLVALCLWGEARGEPIEGQIAVGCVIRNRWRDAAKATTWAEIVLAPQQFSCFNGDDAQAERMQRAAVNVLSASPAVALKQALWLADGIISGATRDNTNGATHYLTTELLTRKPPRWAKDQPILVTIGAHSFLHVA